jgi:predicted AAA+ superfamily ATPase
VADKTTPIFTGVPDISTSLLSGQAYDYWDGPPMTTLDDQLRDQNPWWTDPRAIAQDPHVAKFHAQAIHWDPSALREIPLVPGHTHTLRGPRQVGKTTTVKRLLQRLLTQEHATTRVLYFTCDLVDSYRELVTAVKRAKQIHPKPDGPWHVFLDEVSAVPDWQRAIKYLWDQGVTRNDFLLLTGSSARDVRTGSEQLPGRRGDGEDFLQLPMSFRDFCILCEGITLPPSLSVHELITPSGRTAAASAYANFDALVRAYEQYARIGGYPAAIQDYTTQPTRSIQPATLRALWDVVAGDVSAQRRDRSAALKLMEEVSVCLGNPIAWAKASTAMGLKDREAARDYTEMLADNFLLLPIYFWEMGGSFLPQKQRKVFFVDMLYAEVAAQLISGARRPDDDAVVENLVGMALFRSAATSLLQAEQHAGALGYWRSTNDREIDFVVPTGSAQRFPIEVKGDNDTRIGHSRLAITKSFGRGVVVSRTMFDWHPDVAVIPAPVFLALLQEHPRRTI